VASVGEHAFHQRGGYGFHTIAEDVEKTLDLGLVPGAYAESE
jgi:uncharacterized protein YciU (UPF0263 family)